MQTVPGVLEVITGPMFSGKSEELIRRLKRARIARQRVACYKPDIDLRYHRAAIASHSLQTHEAAAIGSVEELRGMLYPQLDEVGVVGIDEVQFLSPEIIPLTTELVQLASSGLVSLKYPDLEASRGIKKVAERIMQQHLIGGRVVEDLCFARNALPPEPKS